MTTPSSSTSVIRESDRVERERRVRVRCVDGGVEGERQGERERGLDVEKLVIKEFPTRGYITERRSFSNLVILSTNPLFFFVSPLFRRPFLSRASQTCHFICSPLISLSPMFPYLRARVQLPAHPPLCVRKNPSLCVKAHVRF